MRTWGGGARRGAGCLRRRGGPGAQSRAARLNGAGPRGRAQRGAGSAPCRAPPPLSPAMGGCVGRQRRERPAAGNPRKRAGERGRARRGSPARAPPAIAGTGVGVPVYPCGGHRRGAVRGRGGGCPMRTTGSRSVLSGVPGSGARPRELAGTAAPVLAPRGGCGVRAGVHCASCPAVPVPGSSRGGGVRGGLQGWGLSPVWARQCPPARRVLQTAGSLPGVGAARTPGCCRRAQPRSRSPGASGGTGDPAAERVGSGGVGGWCSPADPGSYRQPNARVT